MATESATVSMASLVIDLEKLFVLFALNLLANRTYHLMKFDLKYKPLLFIYTILLLNLYQTSVFGEIPGVNIKQKRYSGIVPGAERTEAYLSLLIGKNVAVVANKTSMVDNTHLVDTLLGSGINIKKIFALEHGFRGDAANGEHIADGKDVKTGLQIISLYGANKKPSAAQLANVDVVIFDFQDVGVRFYTYLTSMHYIMEACAESNKTFIVLDRPNPNGYYTDGPILEKKHTSMVGIHPIPLVHGMTLGELAFMINGEKWLENKDSCPLIVIKCINYDKSMTFELPISPSPNLPSKESIVLYPSLGLLEGTIMSMGRGTSTPFECFGAPWLKMGTYTFTPMDIPGKAVNPPYKGQECRGYELTSFAKYYLINHKKVYLEWLILLYNEAPEKEKFFNDIFFDKLAGTSQLRLDIIAGKSSDAIRANWLVGLNKFKIQRQPYLIY